MECFGERLWLCHPVCRGKGIPGTVSGASVGASIHRELWIPAGDLAEMNRNIVGVIEVIAEYKLEAIQ